MFADFYLVDVKGYERVFLYYASDSGCTYFHWPDLGKSESMVFHEKKEG